MPKILALCPPVKSGDPNSLLGVGLDKQRANTFLGGSMAGDWIKMRTDLAEDPAVIRIAAKSGLSEDEVVGKLHKFWSWANLQTEDGNAFGVTESWIDRYIGVSGFAKLLAEGDGKTPWLTISADGIHIPNFSRHNGKSGKNRALTKERVLSHRTKKNVTQESLQNRYQRREKNSTETEKQMDQVRGLQILEHEHPNRMGG